MVDAAMVVYDIKLSLRNWMPDILFRDVMVIVTEYIGFDVVCGLCEGMSYGDEVLGGHTVSRTHVKDKLLRVLVSINCFNQ